MDTYRICPICHKHNSIDAEECIYCGQRLKARNLSNYSKHGGTKIKSNGSWKSFAFIAVWVVIIFLVVYQKQTINVISKVIPQKVVEVNNISTYINQNDKFKLPSLVGAKMNYGGNKAIGVSWTPKKIDSSVVGKKIIKGKVTGTDKLISFTVTVLPHSIKKSIVNCVVENSMLEFNVNMPKSVKWMCFKVNKGMESKNEFIPVNNGVMKGRIYLPYGTGEYSVNSLTSNNAAQYGYYYQWKDFKVNNEDTRDMRFLSPDTDVQSDSEEIINLAYSITQGCVSNMDKTLAIHDWVSSNIAYDTDAFFSNNIHNYSAIETLNGKKAVCSGYANLTAALNRAVGIKTKIIIGTASNDFFKIYSDKNKHAWNETYVDGKWITQDTTWDAGGVDSLSHKFTFKLSHKYFNPSANRFKLDHTKISEN